MPLSFKRFLILIASYLFALTGMGQTVAEEQHHVPIGSPPTTTETTPGAPPKTPAEDIFMSLLKKVVDLLRPSEPPKDEPSGVASPAESGEDPIEADRKKDVAPIIDQAKDDQPPASPTTNEPAETIKAAETNRSAGPHTPPLLKAVPQGAAETLPMAPKAEAHAAPSIRVPPIKTQPKKVGTPQKPTTRKPKASTNAPWVAPPPPASPSGPTSSPAQKNEPEVEPKKHRSFPRMACTYEGKVYFISDCNDPMSKKCVKLCK